MLLLDHKGRFHETTNHANEREKMANNKIKLIGKTNLNSRPTNVVWSFPGTVVIDVLVADQLNILIVF